jgi:hypothetical protein
MQTIKVEKDQAESIVKRMFWLAYQACGGVSGMGILQMRDETTEDEVFENVKTRGDYPGGPYGKPNEYYGDYVFGRMMKLRVEINGDAVAIPTSKPEWDYQGWSIQYPSYLNLFEEACKSLDIEVGV